MKVLLKKEIKDFFCNYKSWVMILLVTGIFYFLGNRELPIKHFYIWFALLSPLQYVYDSLITDTKSRGMIFFYNSNIRFIHIFLIKVLVSIFLLFVTFILSISFFQKNLRLLDLLWIIPSLCLGVSIMQITAIVSKCAEMTSAFITMGIILAYLQILLLISNLLIIILISICLALVSFFAAWKLSESNYYRTQI